MDSETQEALRNLERTIVDQLHKVQLETSRVAGELCTLTSRFESENGHTRRELGEALKGMEDLRRGQAQHTERSHDAAMKLAELQGSVSSIRSKVEALSDDVSGVRAVEGRVDVMEARNQEKEKTDNRRDLNVRALWAGLIAAGSKMMWDTFGPHR